MRIVAIRLFQSIEMLCLVGPISPTTAAVLPGFVVQLAQHSPLLDDFRRENMLTQSLTSFRRRQKREKDGIRLGRYSYSNNIDHTRVAQMARSPDFGDDQSM